MIPNKRLKMSEDTALCQMLHDEQVYLPKCSPNYLKNHPGLNPRMRAIVLDWLFEVSQEFVLHRATVYMAINFFDRYLSNQLTTPVSRTEVQLVAVTALWIASKMEENLPPPVKDFATVTDGAVSVCQLIEFEQTMVRLLDWQLLPCTAFMFVDYLLKDKGGEVFGKIMEVLDFAMLHVECLQFRPSVLAATAIFIVTRSESDSITPEPCECYEWLTPRCSSFIREVSPEHVFRSKYALKIPKEEQYALQRHHSKALELYKKTFCVL